MTEPNKGTHYAFWGQQTWLPKTPRIKMLSVIKYYREGSNNILVCLKGVAEKTRLVVITTLGILKDEQRLMETDKHLKQFMRNHNQCLQILQPSDQSNSGKCILEFHHSIMWIPMSLIILFVLLINTWLFAFPLSQLLCLPLYFPGQSQTKHFGFGISLCFWFRAKSQLWCVTSSLCQQLFWCLFVCLTVNTLACLKSVCQLSLCFLRTGNFFKLWPVATWNTIFIPSGYTC